MSSSTMREPLAIRLQSVSKIYKLHGSQSDQLIDVLGLKRFGFKTKAPTKEFAALRDISLDVPRGHRIGIVGRNGAGKTTLLKLICGNFAATQGEVEVHGTVQALMSVGLGFHPEYTGRENVEASLQYNGLGRDEYQRAMVGIIEFCELGEFLDQPFKTYSLGMQARLMFASATAIRPDILIVDEVLGAGDAYFVAKSKIRVEKLVSSGCTMLLVSHSMQQVMELCDEAIWLESGSIRMQDKAFLVVKAYEESIHGAHRSVPAAESLASAAGAAADAPPKDDGAASQGPSVPPTRQFFLPPGVLLQEPGFLPHAQAPRLPMVSSSGGFDFVAPGGISRWQSEPGVKVSAFTIQTDRGRTSRLVALRPARFVITIAAEHAGSFDCRYGVAVDNLLGQGVARIFSPPDRFDAAAGDLRTVEIVLNPVQLGPGEYNVGVSVIANSALEQLNNACRYDLLSRSFSISVELPDSLSVLAAGFIHSAEWSFAAGSNAPAAA